MSKKMHRTISQIDSLEPRRLLAANLVADINMSGAASSPLFEPVEYNGALYFVATNGTHGYELWKSDGTPGGTAMLADINPGPNSSDVTGLRVAGGKLYFRANDGTHGWELWSTDGSAAGTQLVKDIVPGAASSLPEYFEEFGGKVYFSAASGNARKIYRTDGTTAGTEVAFDAVGDPRYLRAHNGKLYAGGGSLTIFTLNPSGQLVQSLSRSNTASNFTPLGDLMLFGPGIQVTDGTANGTISLSSTANIPADPYAPLGPIKDDKLIFGANELMSTNGTTAGTVILQDLRPSGNSQPVEFVAAGAFIYFTADDGVNGREIWSTDGTPGGAIRLSDILPGNDPSSFPRELRAVGSELSFIANDFVNGLELWKANGAAISMVADIATGDESSAPFRFAVIGSTLYFEADDGIVGPALWKSDLSAVGTELVKDVHPISDGSFPGQGVRVGNEIYFPADDGVHGVELWKSNGTAAGTVMVADIVTGPEGSYPAEIVELNGQVIFLADDWLHGVELWKSNGTAAGTELVVDLQTGFASGVSELFIAHNGAVYFPGDNGVTGNELWKTDGTAAGTVQVIDLVVGANGSHPAEIVEFDGQLIFSTSIVATTPATSLFRTNGTAAGTSGIGTFGNSAIPYNLTATPDAVYFAGSGTTGGYELWKTTGQTAGTAIVKDINTLNSTASSFPESLFPVGNTLYFTASAAPSSGQSGLWKSDGTAAGTVFVKGIGVGEMAAINGILYFAAFDAATGRELWKSDGTTAGTQLVVDLIPGPANSDPGGFVVNGDRLNFVADSLQYNREIFYTHGVSLGTAIAADVRPGDESSFPIRFTQVDNTLYFAANDNVSGTELWSLSLIDDDAPLADARFDFNTPRQQVVLNFSENISASLALADVTIVDRATNLPVALANLSLQYDSFNQRATINFENQLYNALPDGNYRLTLAAGSIADSLGNALADDLTLDFFTFAGDANRDRAVNIADFSILASRFNLPGTFSQGDFTYDGVTNISDFAILASKFNTSLPAPANLPSAARPLALFSQSPMRNVENRLAEELLVN